MDPLRRSRSAEPFHPPPPQIQASIGSASLTRVQPGFLLVDCPSSNQETLVQLLIHRALRLHPGKVLVYDSSHTFHPDSFAATNRRHGRPEAEHADRTFIQRCMTPFQWDTMLSKHLDKFLAANPGNIALIVAFPYGRLFATDELAEWERVDHLEFSLTHLASRATAAAVPIVAVTDFLALQEQPDLLTRLQAVPDLVRVACEKGVWRFMGPEGSDGSEGGPEGPGGNLHLALSKPQVPAWDGLTSMGMSQPTVTAQIDAFASSFAPFRANLPRREQARFDELVVWARRHGNALNVSEDLDIARRILLVATIALADRHATLAERHEALSTQHGDLSARHDALSTRHEELARRCAALSEQLEARLHAVESRLNFPSSRPQHDAARVPLRRLPESLVQHDGGVGQGVAADVPA